MDAGLGAEDGSPLLSISIRIKHRIALGAGLGAGGADRRRFAKPS